MEHIDVTTRFVRRLSLSFHLAFLCRFLQCIDDKDAESVMDMLESDQLSSETWDKQLSEFMDAGSSKNATFRLHMEMMQHCDEVVAVYLAERLGGLQSTFSAGHFHQCMKKTLYSTPIGNTSTNFASDSKREVDHQDVLRGFRSGSTLPAANSRMSLIDS
ncbi:unnamed protein product [Mytilus coruscus]|uniref:Uncharacterized protein n=1 Tax=Mytilus coruscus TaxID=42192 RepID=A0A6J7ZWN3_MYTCO|nr:unnamed protein product [Mytilus coruscus]